MPDPDDDLDYWLATQALPKEQPEQSGAWQRAQQLLSSQQRPADPMPTRQNGMSWAAALAAIAGKDPGGVLAADAQSRRADMDAWQKRNGPDAQFDRQRALAGTLMQEDAARRAAEGADWQRQHTEGRDAATDQHWQAENDRAATGQAATIENMKAMRALQERGLSQGDKHFYDQIAATKGLHDIDNANDLEKARLAAGVKAAENAVPPIPGFVADNPDVVSKLGKTPEGYRKLADDVVTAKKAQEFFRQLKDLRGKSYSKANEETYSSVIKSAIGDRSKEGSTGALSGTEFERYFTDFPAYTDAGAATSSAGAMLDTLRGRNVGKETLNALEKSIMDTARVKLGTYGGHLEGDAPKPPPARAGVAPPPAPGIAQDDDDPLLRIKGLRRVSP